MSARIPDGCRQIAVAATLLCLAVPLLAQQTTKPTKPVNITVNVPKQEPPVVNVPKADDPPVWPTYVGLLVGIFGTVATVYAAVAAMRAAKATEETVSQMKQVADEESRPYVTISLELDRREKWFDLVMRNVGKTPAIDVTTEGSPLDPSVSNFTVETCGWPTPIPSLAPGQEMRLMLGPAQLFYRKQGWHEDIQVALTYKSQTGAQFNESLKFAFSAFEGTRFDSSGNALERALEDIAENTKMFKQSPIGDGIFWRIWKSLLDSRLELVASETDGSYIVQFRKGEMADNGGGPPQSRVDFSGGSALADEVMRATATDGPKQVPDSDLDIQQSAKSRNLRSRKKAK